MSYLEAIILGVIQGLTEFLPVSSSGHLVIAQHLAPGFSQQGIAFDVLLHLATLAAILVYYRRDIVDLFLSLTPLGDADPESKQKKLADRRLAFTIIVGSIPTAVIGFAAKDYIAEAFSSPKLAAGMLIVTAALLLIGETAARRRRNSGVEPRREVKWTDGIIIGIIQGLAITPGISRSGSTVSAGLMLGIEGRLSGRFSFLLGAPAIFGAGLLEAKNIAGLTGSDIGTAAAGAAAAFLVGLAAIGIFIKMIGEGKLWVFAAYCALLGLTGIIML